jgi:hypothetical protein
VVLDKPVRHFKNLQTQIPDIVARLDPVRIFPLDIEIAIKVRIKAIFIVSFGDWEKNPRL